MKKNNYGLDVIINNIVLTEYSDPSGAYFVEGRKGSKYSLFLTNNTSIDAKFVVSVDGLNIITGDTTWEQGWVVKKFSTAIIPGWFIDNKNVAEFVFNKKKHSYNHHNLNSKSDVGVIGARIFKEETGHQLYYARGIVCSSAVNNLGTEYGDKQDFGSIPVNTAFSHSLTEQIVLYYDDVKGLLKRGIDVSYRNRKYANPFPQQVDGCPQPTKNRVK